MWQNGLLEYAPGPAYAQSTDVNVVAFGTGTIAYIGKPNYDNNQ